ncbi:MAG: FG-GAP repeat domain-containing protein, partial [Phycisphaerales bacterium]
GSLVLSAGQSIAAFVVGDLNADGRTDIVLQSNQSAQLRAFFRNNTGGFDSAPVISSATVGGIAAMELGRFARGAFPDLVLATNAGTYVLRNATGAGFTSFAAGVALSNSAGVQRIDVVDLNADAVPDLVLGNFQSNIVLGVVNTSPVGALSFGATVLSTLGTDVNFFGSYVVGDLDADGRADLLGLQTKNRLLRGSGTGAFIAPEDYRRITAARLAAVFGQRDTDPAPELFVVGTDFIDVVDSLNPIGIVPPTIQSVVPSDDAYARGQPLVLTVAFGAPAAAGSRVQFIRDNGNGVLDNGDIALATVPATASGAVFNQVLAADAPAGLTRIFALPLTPAGIAGGASSTTFTVIDRTIAVQVVGTSVSPAGAATVFTVSIRYQVDGTVSNLDSSSLSNGDVTLTSPTGGVIVGTLGVVTPNPADRSLTSTYTFAAPGGFWDYPDNGAYALRLVADQVAFAGGQGFLAAQPLQTFNLFFQNPVVSLSGTVLNANQLVATVRYTDNIAMSWGSMDNADVELRGPNGLIIPAVLTSRVINPSTTISATYTFTAPGGAWDSPDNGAYELWVQPAQVWDAMGYPIATQRLTVYNLWFNNPTAERVSEVVTDGGTFFDLTVRYTDFAGSPAGISWGSIGDGDVELVGPSGYLESGLLRSRNIPVPGQLVATYRFPARGGAWDHTDSGSYTARTRVNQVIDNQGYPVPVINLRTYGLYFVSPSVNVIATDVAAGRPDMLVAVTYRGIGSTLMSWASIGDGDDLELSGPAGFTAISSLVSRVYNASTNTYTVTYRLGAPGGTWNSADNGAYVLRTRAGEVFDSMGRLVPAYAIATYSLFF